MTPWETILWWTLALVGVVGSSLFSGLETGVYTLNRIRLHLLAQSGHRSARVLGRLVSRPSALLATLLIGNNVTNYLATSATGVLLKAHHLSDWGIILAVVLIVTPVLFIFGETLPKDLFAAHADKLVYPFARPLAWASRLFTVIGLQPLITWSSELVMRSLGSGRRATAFHPRRQVEVLVKEGVGWGLISDEQSALVDRVLDLANRRLRDEMVPWSQVTTIKADDPVDVLWSLGHRTSLSRFPVVDGSVQASSPKVLGMVTLYDAWQHERDQCPPIRQLLRPTAVMDAATPLRTALRQLQKSKTALAVVMDRGRPAGIVTIKDLVEPITGELASW